MISFFCTTLNAQLAGTYFIGPQDSVRADFHSFAEVADTLNSDGITDPVVFNILPHFYPEARFTLDTINGADADNQIVFQSSTGDSTSVTLDPKITKISGLNQINLTTV